MNEHDPDPTPEPPPPPPPSPGDEDSWGQRRRVRPSRDTVVISDNDFFDNLGIHSIPMREFHELADLIAMTFGIKLGEGKRTLVTGRIHPMMEKYGFKTHRECLDAIKNDPTGELVSELANRISTNHTAFFREDAHFKLLLEQVLPDIVKRKGERGDRDLRVWCAACASGEEAYSILFTLLKFLNFEYGKWRAGVLATDISADSLDAAKRGVYSRQRLEPVPIGLRNLFFEQIDDDNFSVKPEYKREVTFRRLNLINDTYPFRMPFDVIFCRNVMIYFSRGVRAELLSRLHDWLVPGGYLFVGHSESLVGGHTGYEYVAPAVYRRCD